MRINTTGQVTDHFHVIGQPGIPVYLVDSPQPALFDAGITALANDYIHDLEHVMGDRSPAYLFLTHSHFDHVGSAARLKIRWPEMKIAASAKTRDLMRKPKAVQLMKHLNEQAAKAVRSWGKNDLFEGPFDPPEIDLVLEPGQKISLGQDKTLTVLPSPGHTWDFFSFWIEPDRVLIASEAVGCLEHQGDIVAEFLVDYDAYRASLMRLSRLGAKILCPGHHLVLTNGDVPWYLKKSLEDAGKFQTRVDEILQEEQGDVDRTVNRIKTWQYDPKPVPKQPEPAYLINTRARVLSLRARMVRRGLNQWKIPEAG